MRTKEQEHHIGIADQHLMVTKLPTYTELLNAAKDALAFIPVRDYDNARVQDVINVINKADGR